MKKQTCSKKIVSLILSIMLIVAMALCTTGCNDKNSNNETSSSTPSLSTTALPSGTASSENNNDITVLGEGSKEFTFIVVDKDGTKTQFEIHTDKENVGDALEEVNLIEGENSAYGLYVKTVNGIQADYAKDGVFWAFYINDESATQGVSSTDITEGYTYSFKVES